MCALLAPRLRPFSFCAALQCSGLHMSPPTLPPSQRSGAGASAARAALTQKWRGVEHGPAAIRNARLIERLSSIGCAVYDVGDLHVAQVPNDKLYNNTVKYPRTVGLACQMLANEVRRVLEAGHTCVTLGGDHSLALGTISGHARQYSDLCVIWVDAHADINTPLTTSSGNLHGQPVSFLLRELQDKVPSIPGFSWIKPCLSTSDIVYIGLRDLDAAEQFILKKYAITYYSMRQIDCLGIQKVMERSFEQLLGSVSSASLNRLHSFHKCRCLHNPLAKHDGPYTESHRKNKDQFI